MNDYTSGNWTVSDQYADTVSATKNLAVPDLSYSADFVVAKDEPDEVIINNTTASDLAPHESIRYARSTVKDIYAGVQNVDTGNASPVKRGVQVMVELATVYHAVNSVTGEEYDLPCKGRLVLRLPNASYVTEALAADLLKRTVSAATDTGAVTESRIVSMARGSLAP